MERVFPHALPYLLFAVLSASADVLPSAFRPWIDPCRTVLVGAALIALVRRGTYPELRERSSAAGVLAASAAGVVVGLTWIPLAECVPLAVGERAGFDPAAAGDALRPWLLASRLLGFVLVVPLMEELFVRSLLPRVTDALAADGDWRDRRVGAFTPLSFAVSLAFFTLTHPEWLAALVAGLLWMLLLRRTRRLRDAVLAHAVANAWLAGTILLTGAARWW